MTVIREKFSTKELPNIDSSLSFSEDDQYLEIPFKEEFNFTNTDSFHISCYYKFDTPRDVALFYNKYNGTVGFNFEAIGRTFHLWINGTNFTLPNTPAFYENNWLHLAVNFEGDGTNPSTAEFFLNGLSVYKQSEIVTDFSNLKPCRIGQRLPGTGTFEMSNLRVFSRVLSPEEVLFNCQNPGLIYENTRGNCILELPLQSNTIGNTHTFKEALITTGGTEQVTSSDVIPLGKHPFSICAFTNISDYTAAGGNTQNLLNGTIGTQSFSFDIFNPAVSRSISLIGHNVGGGDISHAQSTPIPTTSEPYTGTHVDNRNNFSLINKTNSSIDNATNPWKFQINATKGNCLVHSGRNTFHDDDWTFSDVKLLNPASPTAAGQIQQIAIFINDAGGVYALNDEQQDFIYNQGQGNNLLSEQAREMGIGQFGTDVIGKNGITTLIIRLWEFENGAVVERIANTAYTLTGGATISPAINEKRTILDTAFKYNRAKVYSKEPNVLLHNWTTNIPSGDRIAQSYIANNPIQLEKIIVGSNEPNITKTIADLVVDPTKKYTVRLDVESLNVSGVNPDVYVKLNTVKVVQNITHNSRQILDFNFDDPNINSTLEIGIDGTDTNAPKFIVLHVIEVFEKGKRTITSPTNGIALGYSNAQIGSDNHSQETVKRDFYTARNLSGVGMRGDSSTGLAKFINFGDIPELKASNPFTLIVDLFLRDEVHTNEFIFEKFLTWELIPETQPPNNANGFSFWTSGGGYLRGSELAVNKRYRVAITFTTTKKVIYVNGVEDASVVGTFATPDNVNAITCMNRINVTNGGIPSTIYEAHIFNTELSAQQLRDDFNELLDISSLPSHKESWYFKENKGVIKGLKGNYDGTVVGYDTSLKGSGLFEERSSLLPPIKEVYDMDNGLVGGRPIRIDNYAVNASEFTCIIFFKKNKDGVFSINAFDTFLTKRDSVNNLLNINLATIGNTRKIVNTNQTGSSNFYWGNTFGDNINSYKLDDFIVICFKQSPVKAEVFFNGESYYVDTTPSNPTYHTFFDIDGGVGSNGMTILGEPLFNRSLRGKVAFFGLWSSELPVDVIKDISVELLQGNISRYLNAINYPNFSQEIIYQFQKGSLYADSGDLRIRNLARDASGNLKPQYDGFPLGYSAEGTPAQQLSFVRNNLIQPFYNEKNVPASDLTSYNVLARMQTTRTYPLVFAPTTLKSGSVPTWIIGGGDGDDLVEEIKGGTINAVLHSSGTKTVQVVAEDDPVLLTQFTCQFNNLVGVLDLSPLTGMTYCVIAGNDNIANDEGMTQVINPVSSALITTYDAHSNKYLSEINLTGLSKLGGSIRFDECDALTSLTFPGSDQDVTSLRAHHCSELITVDVSNMTGLGGDFWVHANSKLTTVSHPNSGRPFSTYYANGCDISGLRFNTLTAITEIDDCEINVRNNSMNASDVNQILVDLDTIASNGFTGRIITIDGSNAAPDATSGGNDGLAAKTSLIAKGFTVNTN